MSKDQGVPTYGERFKLAFSTLSVMAANFLPKDFKAAMIELAFEVDRLKAENQMLKEKGITHE